MGIIQATVCVRGGDLDAAVCLPLIPPVLQVWCLLSVPALDTQRVATSLLRNRVRPSRPNSKALWSRFRRRELAETPLLARVWHRPGKPANHVLVETHATTDGLTHMCIQRATVRYRASFL
ncbi:hypothetical protein FKP32DRAFT_385323 [Trametes sanguinea]|nr:hypothetical protein FKP32DRAFT_385323 [Trametes sanguinea]